MSATSDVLKKLEEIEAEMRRLGYWSDSLERTSGICETKYRSALDAPTFQVWVQGLFLPSARATAMEGKLPARSQAGEIARRQYAAQMQTPDAKRLLNLIREFDELCIKASEDKRASQGDPP